MDAPTNQPRRAPERFEPVAGLVAILFPGAGHWILGEHKRGAYIACGVLGLFFGGILIGGIDVIDREEDPIWFFGQAMVGPLPFALDWYHQNHVKGIDPHGKHRSAGPRESIVKESERGRTVRRIRPTEAGMRGPPNSKSLAKMNEIGTLYATIAGMLNLIAILDAAFHRRVVRVRQITIAGARG